jgi:hypothetical protein
VRGGEVDHDGLMFRGSILDEYRIGYGQTINLGWVGDDTKPEAIQHVSTLFTLPLPYHLVWYMIWSGKYYGGGTPGAALFTQSKARSLEAEYEKSVVLILA